MRLTRMIAVAAALSVALSPAFAAPANRAAKLSLKTVDTVTQEGGGGAPAKSRGHGSSTWLLAGGAVALVVVGAVALGGSDHKRASA